MSEPRRKLKLGVYPKHILMRVSPELFHRLHLRAARHGRSLNFELNEIVRLALDSKKAANPAD